MVSDYLWRKRKCRLWFQYWWYRN